MRSSCIGEGATHHNACDCREAEFKHWKDEAMEQARLLGMSGSREVSLLARIQDLERSLSEKDRMIRDLQIRDTRKTSVDERHNPPDEYKSIPRSKT